MAHELLVERAKKAIDAVFGDTSVAPSTTKESLEELADEISLRLDCLKEDGVE